MVTIGDVLAIVSVLLGVGVTSWALMVCCGLLFPNRVENARAVFERHGLLSIGTGLLTLIPGLIGLVLLSVQLPGVKLIGWTLILAVLAIGALGAAGLGHLAGRTLTRMSPDMAPYPAFVRGCAFLVAGSMLPLLGWFAFGPLALLAALGAGARALALPSAPPRISEVGQ
jgi:hypothetical protein